MTLLQDFVALLKADYEADNLPVPGLPAVALKVRHAVERDDQGVNDIARLILIDPALTARIIQVANSARYGGMPVETCRAAVARIGMSGVRDLVIAFAVRATFQVQLPALQPRMMQLWRHSVKVAAVSRVLAGLGPGLDPERGMLAGLVHDIGMLPLLVYAQDFPELVAQPGLLDKLSERLRGSLGALVLQKWGFDREFVALPKEVENYLRDPGGMPDYADVVLLANVFAGFGKAGDYKGPPLTQLPAFGKFPLGALGPEGGVGVLEEAQEEINAVMKMLNG